MYYLSRFRHYLKDSFAISQLKAFFAWTKVTEDAKQAACYVDFGLRNYYCDYRQKIVSPTTDLQFIVSKPKQLVSILKELGLSNEVSVWKSIFSSAHLEIWENSSKHQTVLPLRFGLTDVERKFLAQLARAKLTAKLLGRESQRLEVPSRLLQTASVDAALWVDGELRGSIITEETSLIDSVQTATIAAAKDSRFKPLTASELQLLDIEITLIHQLRIPLSQSEIDSNHIYPEKSYHIKTADKTGWYVPAVFNCVNFRHLGDLVARLQIEKLGLTETDPRLSPTLSEVDDFIELHSDIGRPHQLNGPLFAISGTSPNVPEMCCLIVKNLAANQEANGNIIAIRDPLSGDSKTTDWLRLAHAAWALLEYGKRHRDETAWEVGTRSYDHLSSNLFTQEPLDTYTKTLSLIYLYHAADYRDDTGAKTKINSELKDLIPLVHYEPILYLQLAQYLIKSEVDIEQARHICHRVEQDFNTKIKIRNGVQLDLTSYADLVVTLKSLAIMLGDTTLLERARDIYAWYTTQLNADGSFPTTPTDRRPYTRGTAKILEALTRSGLASDSFSSTYLWLGTMQYTEKQAFFIRKGRRLHMTGSFRHDLTNTSTWIDAGAHVLLSSSIAR